MTWRKWAKGCGDATRNFRAHRTINPIGCFGFFCGDAHEASSKDEKVIVTLAGEITEGDSDTLKTIIRKANDNGRLVSLVRLNSPGGSILEGVKLADIVRFGKIATSVIGTSQCASACFIVFAAGSEKHASYTASVGVHGVSDEVWARNRRGRGRHRNYCSYRQGTRGSVEHHRKDGCYSSRADGVAHTG